VVVVVVAAVDLVDNVDVVVDSRTVVVVIQVGWLDLSQRWVGTT